MTAIHNIGPSTELEAMEPGGGDGLTDVAAARPLRKDVWRRFKQNRLAMVGLVIVIVLVLAALVRPAHRPLRRSPTATPGTSARVPPEPTTSAPTPSVSTCSAGWSTARGCRSRSASPPRAIALIIGLFLGAVAGFFGRFLDSLIMRVTDIFLAIPYIVLAVAIASLLGRSENTVIIVLGFTGWLGICRIVRSSFLSLRQLEYVEAASALGYSKWRIMFRHILPNALQPIIVYGTIAVGSVILSEAALSFLGVGPTDPTPAWGLMVADGKSALANAPHMLFFPGAAIFVTVLAFVFIGDGLRDALDPKLK